MACFLVPGAEAIVTTIVTKALESKEKKETAVKPEAGSVLSDNAGGKKHFSAKLKGLNRLLWGGSALLAFEHLWHGEIQPFFPFLTAAADPADAAEMLHEMSTVGVAMAAAVTCVWGIGTYVLHRLESAPERREDVSAVKEAES